MAQFKANGLKDWVSVFKSGTWTDMHGRTSSYSEQDIDTIIEATKKFGEPKIPFVMGHPSNNLPVYGYFKKEDIRKVAHNGQVYIEVMPDDLAMGFAEAAKELDKKELSVGISDKNMAIFQVGFVTKGAVKELPKPFEYAQQPERPDAHYFSIPESEFPEDEVSFKDKIMKYFQEFSNKKEKGSEVMDKELEKQYADKISALESKLNESDKLFSAEKEKFEAERLSMVAKLSEIEKTKRMADHEKFYSEHIEQITPARKNLAIAIMEKLSTDSAYKFSETESVDTLKGFQEWVGALPKVVDTSKGGQANAGDANPNTGGANAGDELIRGYMKENKGTTLKQATLAIAKAHPELFRDVL